jgi:transcriptional regulator with XRE-family HTH domain
MNLTEQAIKRRKRKGISQAEVARRTGAHRTSIVRLESNPDMDITVRVLKRYLEGINCALMVIDMVPREDLGKIIAVGSEDEVQDDIKRYVLDVLGYDGTSTDYMAIINLACPSGWCFKHIHGEWGFYKEKVNE